MVPRNIPIFPTSNAELNKKTEAICALLDIGIIKFAGGKLAEQLMKTRIRLETHAKEGLALPNQIRPR